MNIKSLLKNLKPRRPRGLHLSDKDWEQRIKKLGYYPSSDIRELRKTHH